MAFRQFFFGLCSGLCGILISLNAPAQTANYSSSPQLGVTGTITAAIQTASGNYLSAVDGGITGGSGNTFEGVAIQPADGTAGEFGTFTVVWLDPSYKKFALRTSSGNYVTAINGGGVGGPNDNSSPIHTDATSISDWETFRLNFLPNNQVTIRAATGSYLNAVNGGGVNGTSMSPIQTSATQIGPAETFTLVPLGASTLQQDASKAGQPDTTLAGAVPSQSQQTIVSPPPGIVPIAQSTSTQNEINPLTGPSFPCPKPQDPLAQLFCTSPQLALLDMQFVKTYDALHQQIGPAGDEALRQEDVALELTIRSRCGIAMPQGNSPSPPPPAPPGSDQCVIAAYQQQIATWKSSLYGAAAEEANRSIPDQIALQARLKALGYLPQQAQLDSVFGAGTRAAIIKWQMSASRPATGLLGNDDAQILLGTNSQTSTSATIPSNSEAPGSSVEQAWQQYIPDAACMAQHGFSLQTFVQQGVPPTDIIASQAIKTCETSPAQNLTSPSKANIISIPPSPAVPNNQNPSPPLPQISSTPGNTSSAQPSVTTTSGTSGSGQAVAPASGLHIGDSVTEGQLQITVTSVNLYSNVGGEFLTHTASQGGILVAVQYTFKNISNKPIDSFSQPSPHLIDSSGTSYDSDDDATGAFAEQINEDQKVLSDLNPGITTQGADVFEVSTDSYNANTWHLYFGDDTDDSFALVTR